MKKLLLLILIIFSLSFKVFSNEDKISKFNMGMIVNFGNFILFDLNSSKLENEARKVIEENANYLLYPEKVWGKANDMTLSWLKENAYFLLIGGTWQELEDENEKILLSYKRIKSSADYLVFKGVPKNMIVVAALSDQNPLFIDYDCTQRDIEKDPQCINRYAQLEIIRKNYSENYITYSGKEYPIIKYENIDEAISGELKEYEPPEEEIEIKKKISILRLLLDEGDINKQQYEELKFIVISYHLTGTSTEMSNSKEDNKEIKILEDQLNELKKQTNIQSNESTLKTLCMIFKGLRGFVDCI